MEYFLSVKQTRGGAGTNKATIQPTLLSLVSRRHEPTAQETITNQNELRSYSNSWYVAPNNDSENVGCAWPVKIVHLHVHKNS